MLYKIILACALTVCPLLARFTVHIALRLSSWRRQGRGPTLPMSGHPDITCGMV